MPKQWENFFTDLSNTTPFLKMAAEGGAGTGKTWTLALVIVGLHKRIGSTKPVVLFDTEKAGKFLRPLFAQHGIRVLVKESRTLADLAETMKFCHDGNSDILMIDSITHVYENYLDAFKSKKGRTYIQFQDWGIIKPVWRKEFSERLTDSNCHILFTGREGFTYEHEVNADTGKKELVKTGVKMRAEGDTAYEPDVLIRMERFERILGDDKDVWREATVVKGRGDLLDGMVIRNPTYEHFAPVVEFLLSDVTAAQSTTSHADAGLFADEEDNREYNQNRKILLERNQAMIDEVAAGTSGAAKALRLSILKYAYYGETSETAVLSMSIDQLTEGNARLNDLVPVVKRILNGESFVYPAAKAIAAARAKYLGEDCVEDIIAAGLEKLIAYRDHVIEKYRQLNTAG